MLEITFDSVEAIGFAAAILTTVAFIPQVVQVIKTSSVEGLSLLTYIIFVVGVFLWFLYGFIKIAWHDGFRPSAQNLDAKKKS